MKLSTSHIKMTSRAHVSNSWLQGQGVTLRGHN